ncbi:hypothetical protein OY671_008553, partial [Metschnikowia pulcherrima]
VGNVEAIDAAMKLGAHHPMGPSESADFIGLDTCSSIMQVLHEGSADSKYRPCPSSVKYVEAGWLGRKSQRGFYDYRGDKPCLSMDVMSIVSSMMAMQAASTQQQIATSVMKQNIDSEKSVSQSLQPAANNPPGVGGNLDISV